MAGPGEVSITLTVDPGKRVDSGIFTLVEFSLFDMNAEKIAGKRIQTSEIEGSKQAVARVEVTRRQLVVLSVHFIDGDLMKSVGGKYRMRIDGAIELSQNGSAAPPTDTEASACLPKQGTLIIKMKDGSKKIIDLSEAETITVVP
jgi:hypothetical protein